MLDPHLSALLWMGVLATLVIVIIMPQPLGIRALVMVTILRLIFSVGLEPTLFLLGAFNVSCLPLGVSHPKVLLLSSHVFSFGLNCQAFETSFSEMCVTTPVQWKEILTM